MRYLKKENKKKEISNYINSTRLHYIYVTDPSLRTLRRRSSASERAKEVEAINCIVSGRNVLITGGAAGLGYAFLNHFLKHGAKVSLMIQTKKLKNIYKFFF